MKAPFYITTPIYYVNSNPHIGHAYTSILCDAITRARKIFGHQTYFLTGTDEHGDKIAKSAAIHEKTCQEWVDTNSQNFKDLLPKINIQNNDFIRTTEERHKIVVQDILQKVYDKGDIYFHEYEGKYCVGCERFLADDDLTNGLCKDHLKAPELIKEKNYFFKMSKYWTQLQAYIEKNPEFITPHNFRSEVIGLLKMTPVDLCISRPKSRLTWGIDLPWDKDFVTYVWFDALINYVSALNYPEGDLFKTYWAHAHHVIGKDILKPHCIYWPTMLLSLGIELPQQVAIHGYWLTDNHKMSKSQGQVISPLDYVDQFGSDPLRYFLLKAMNFGRDANFAHDDFIKLINADFANNLGNLYSRVTNLIRKNFPQQIPELKVNMHLASTSENHLLALKSELAAKLEKSINSWDFNHYLSDLMAFSSEINKYIDEKKPWALAKDPEKIDELAMVLTLSLDGICECFYFMSPVAPIWSEKVLSELNANKINKSNNNIRENNFWTYSQNLPSAITGFMRLEEKKQ